MLIHIAVLLLAVGGTHRERVIGDESEMKCKVKNKVKRNGENYPAHQQETHQTAFRLYVHSFTIEL